MKTIISILVICTLLSNSAIARPRSSTTLATLIGVSVAVVVGTASCSSPPPPPAIVVTEQPKVVYVEPEPEPQIVYVEQPIKVVYYPSTMYVPNYQYVPEYRHRGNWRGYRHIPSRRRIAPPPPNVWTPKTNHRPISNNGLRRR